LEKRRKMYQKEVSCDLAITRDKKDADLQNILSEPAPVFRSLRSAPKCSAPSVKKLHVGVKIYSGENVAGGMYDSLNSLKAPSMEQHSNNPSYLQAVEIYHHIIMLASAGGKIGGKKVPELDRSWRTISCCPLLAKAMATYLVQLYNPGWSDAQAPTQSSHNLAALCVTEAVLHGLHISNEHVYCEVCLRGGHSG
jgi:hypothetical protein